MNEILIDDDAAFEAPVRTARFEPSEYQSAIFNWIPSGTGDAIVNAVAGSGKTTTLTEASKLLPDRASAIFCAFNAHIVKELTKRLNGMECKTIHSIGLSTLARHFDKQPVVDGNKYRNLVRKESWQLAEQMPTVNRGEIVSALGDLVELCMVTLTNALDFISPAAARVIDSNSNAVSQNALESLQTLVSHFGLTLPCPIVNLAPSVAVVLANGILLAHEDHVISFSDMLWLPWVWGLQPRTYDWVFVDECQDLNRAQLEMVLKLRGSRRLDGPHSFAIGRMIFVGDPRQAIYGFSGADAASYANIKERTQATEFPLSVSYRCPVLVVREAQAIVPGIQPRPGAPLGTVRWISENELYANVKEGDLLLCRMTAPLIATCLDLIRQKVPARVRGKDIGKMLVKTVQIVAGRRDFEFATFPQHLHGYTTEQIKKLSGRDDAESQVERLWDISQALTACFDGLNQNDPFEFDRNLPVNSFIDFIHSLFSDDRPGVWLSTVHKAKGLEAERVFILRPEKLPLVWRGQQAWEMEQEMNLKYVAITRSLDELVYVRQAGEQL
jgi:superfamily I DNA/RNA helicase